MLKKQRKAGIPEGKKTIREIQKNSEIGYEEPSNDSVERMAGPRKAKNDFKKTNADNEGGNRKEEQKH